MPSIVATDEKNGRKYMLDDPDDLKPGEPVTFLLNLHGGGSHGPPCIVRSSDRVLGASHPLQEASEVIYEAIHARITELVSKTKYGCRYVILMGAILSIYV